MTFYFILHRLFQNKHVLHIALIITWFTITWYCIQQCDDGGCGNLHSQKKPLILPSWASYEMSVMRIWEKIKLCYVTQNCANVLELHLFCSKSLYCSQSLFCSVPCGMPSVAAPNLSGTLDWGQLHRRFYESVSIYRPAFQMEFSL